MPYHVVALTMAQVRQGGLAFQRELGTALRESPEIKVYAVNPFDLDERKRARDRYGGDIVYFFNDAARQTCEILGIDLNYIAEISESELPKKRSVVIGLPEK
jgi:hypothetical protein